MSPQIHLLYGRESCLETWLPEVRDHDYCDTLTASIILDRSFGFGNGKDSLVWEYDLHSLSAPNTVVHLHGLVLLLERCYGMLRIG